MAGVAGFEPAHTGVKILDLNRLATPHHGTPHRIRTDTLQILNLLPAANWASGALSWPYYYYPILAYSVSNPIHRAMENIVTLSQCLRSLLFIYFTPTNFSYAPDGCEPRHSI